MISNLLKTIEINQIIKISAKYKKTIFSNKTNSF